MKDGRTHLAHKAEHAVDLSSGALLAVTVQAADKGDTTTIFETLEAMDSALEGLGCRKVAEVVADKGYHSNGVLVELNERGLRSYVSEPDRGRRRWQGKSTEQEQVYGNRRRLRGRRNKRLQKKRAELAERCHAHMYETGGMRRVYLRGRENILKRALIQRAGFNLALLLRSSLGVGKPRQMRALAALLASVNAAYSRLRSLVAVLLDSLALSYIAVRLNRASHVGAAPNLAAA